MLISPPSCLKENFRVPPRLLMGPGPSNCPPRILNATSHQMLGHLDKDFLQIMEETKMGIKYAFQTENEYTFAVSGTGHCAMETAIVNILEPGDVFLCIISGIWGERAMEIGRRIGAKCHMIRLPLGEVLTVENLEKEMKNVKPGLLFVCHGESSTGLLQPLGGIGEICQKYGCLFLVDAVASLGGCPLYMDEYGIDVLYSASQKVLNAPPGLSPISFSRAAVKKIQERTKIHSFYMDVLHLGNYWNCDNDKIRYHHTAPISLVYALREALAILAEETLEECWKRHKMCSELLHRGLEEIGLNLLISKEAHRLPTLTAVKVPDHTDPEVVTDYLKRRFNIEIANGLGPTSGLVWRIGLMGVNCTEENVNIVLKSISEALRYFKRKSLL